MVAPKFDRTSAENMYSLFSMNTGFQVPAFQRNYSWSRERCEDLWKDILDSFTSYKDINENSSQYLLGPIVLVENSENNDQRWVIDGQQRFATMTMLFCVMRDLIYENTDKIEGFVPEGIANLRNLIEKHHKRNKTGWRLTLNKLDKEFFKEIQNYQNDKGEYITSDTRIKQWKSRMRDKLTKGDFTKSIKRLVTNYEFLHEKLKCELLTEFEDIGSTSKEIISKLKMECTDSSELDSKIKQTCQKNIPYMLDFLEHISHNIHVIRVLVNDDDAAFQIFETLNDRGTQLSKSDLVKNHVLRLIDPDEQDVYSQQWDELIKKVLGGNKADDDFLFISFYSHMLEEEKENKKKIKISKKRLYRYLRDRNKVENDAKDYMKQLDIDSTIFTMFNDPNQADDEIIDDINAIQLLGARYIRIPILIAYRKWNNKENRSKYHKIVKLLVHVFFKYKTVLNIHAGGFEQIIQSIGKNIAKDSSIEVIINDILKTQNYDQEDFLHKFERLQPNESVAKYILKQITISMGSKYDDMNPNEHLTLEHILPQTINENHWPKNEFFKGYDDSAQIDDFIKKIGNLTLLMKSINSKIKNHDFITKRDHKDKNGNLDGYKSSLLQINKKTVIENDEWTAKIINERSILFRNEANKIWSEKNFGLKL